MCSAYCLFAHLRVDESVGINFLLVTNNLAQLKSTEYKIFLFDSHLLIQSQDNHSEETSTKSNQSDPSEEVNLTVTA